MKKISSTKVFYIDSFSYNQAHEMFNASLILMCSMIFEKVDCRIHSTSYANYLKIIDRPSPENVKHKNLFVVKGKNRLLFFLRYIIGAILNIWYLIFSSKDEVLIFPYNNLFALRILNALNKFYKRRIIVFCHGEMEGLATDVKTGGFLHRILTRLSHNFFLNKKLTISEGLYFSVLGEVLQKNISEKIDPIKASKFISIDHSYLFYDVVVPSNENGVLNIATVGLLNEAKGLYSLVEFATKIKSSLRDKIRISVIGKTDGDQKLLKQSKIDLSTENRVLLSRDEFNSLIQKQDYLIYFYPHDSYRLVASGAIFDAICYEKPILALKNDYFEYIFKKFGEFGFLFTDISTMIQHTEAIVEADFIDLDFKSIKEKLTPENICQEFFKEMVAIGFVEE